jgi:hypothetical protein
LVLDNTDGPSSLAVSMSMVVELFEGRIDTAAANGVHRGSRSMLVATMLHFLELRSELELLGSGRNVDLIEDEVVALWTRVCLASDSQPSCVPSSVSPPDGTGE